MQVWEGRETEKESATGETRCRKVRRARGKEREGGEVMGRGETDGEKAGMGRGFECRLEGRKGDRGAARMQRATDGAGEGDDCGEREKRAGAASTSKRELTAAAAMPFDYCSEMIVGSKF